MSCRQILSQAHGRLVLAVVFAVQLTGCSPETLLEPLNWAAPRANVERITDVPYGAVPRQRLDIYLPARPSGAPVILFWHGGSWQSGSKDHYRFVGAALAERGFVAIVPNYRLAPEFPFPAFVQDAALAVTWASKNARSFGADTDRLYLSGHSAGGHVALLLALDERYLRDVGLDRRMIAGTIAIAPPTGLENLRGDGLEGVFPAVVPDLAFSPISLARAEAATASPFLLLSGMDDEVIYASSVARLGDTIRQSGGRATNMAYPDTGHLGLLLDFSAPFGGESAILDEVAAFAGLRR
jgi:acetyl esterase/lipase